jgi:hypothetical protein
MHQISVCSSQLRTNSGNYNYNGAKTHHMRVKGEMVVQLHSYEKVGKS